MSYLKMLPVLLRWLGASFITYELATVVEDVGDKFPDAVDADVTIDATGSPVAPGPYRAPRSGVLAMVLVAAAISYGMQKLAKRLK